MVRQHQKRNRLCLSALIKEKLKSEVCWAFPVGVTTLDKETDYAFQHERVSICLLILALPVRCAPVA